MAVDFQIADRRIEFVKNGPLLINIKLSLKFDSF